MLASIPSPSFNILEIGPLDIHVYGITMALAVGAAYLITTARYGHFGGDRILAERTAFWAAVLGFAGARLAHVSTHLGKFTDDPLAFFRLWEGGIALFGGLTFGTITAFVVMRRGKGNFLLFADSIAVGLPAAQFLGRIGNYFNQELFGKPTGLPWGLEIDAEHRAFLPDEYRSAETFHPTFLYEMMWNAGIIVFLLWLERKRNLRRGTLFSLYWILYGFIRFMIELLRIDTTFRFWGLSRNGWVSLGVMLGGSLLLWWVYRKPTVRSWDEAAELRSAREEEPAPTAE